MTIFFADTSALAKRYFVEQGSRYMRALTRPTLGNKFVISSLTTVEVISSFARREREGRITSAIRIRAENYFLLHTAAQYLVIAIDALVLQQARAFVVAYGLRTLDAIQLACAVRSAVYVTAPMIFLCADSPLLTAAAAEGFPIDNPNNYP